MNWILVIAGTLAAATLLGGWTWGWDRPAPYCLYDREYTSCTIRRSRPASPRRAAPAAIAPKTRATLPQRHLRRAARREPDSRHCSRRTALRLSPRSSFPSGCGRARLAAKQGATRWQTNFPSIRRPRAIRISRALPGLQGTQFVTVWRNTSTQDIKGRLFGVNGVASSGEFNVDFAASGRHQAATPDSHRDALRLCGRMDRAIARRHAAAEASRLRCRYAVRAGKPGEQRRGRTADPARDGALGRRRLRRRLGRQAQRRAYPRAALRARRHEKRRGVSRQHHPGAASRSNGGRPDRTEIS